MKLLGLASLAVFLGVSSATEQMQINYYYDSGCSDYIGQIDVTWASYSGDGSNCYNYNYGTSVNIANCYENYCFCSLYQQENCNGNVGSIIIGGSGNTNCIPDSSAYYSFACYYY
jgi:hypothetical protein